MSAQTRITQDSPTTRRNIRIASSVQTTDATPTVAYSIPLGQQRASFLEVKAIAIQSDFSATESMSLQCGFRRASGGNVVKATPANNKGFYNSNGDFSGTHPSLDLVANTGTQSIDLQVTGKSATTINWHFAILSIQNLT